MKPGRNRLQLRVLRRLEDGLPPTRWQQFSLHLQTAWRSRSRWDVQRICFHTKGLTRILWKPFTLFRFIRVPVQIHATFLLYPVGIFAWQRFNEEGGRGLLWALVFLFVFSCSMLVHEFGHVFAARQNGIGTHRIIMVPFGAIAQLESIPSGPGEIWIALAGPLTNLLLVGIFGLALYATSPWGKYWLSGRFWLLDLRHAFRIGFVLNLIEAIFNLLPCFPMDGGRVLRSALAVLIRHLFPRHAAQAFLIATRIAVRYVAWPVVLGMLALTILHTRVWIHLLLFPLLALCAEAEYWVVRTENGPSRTDDP